MLMMPKPLATLLGVALLAAGASVVSAQESAIPERFSRQVAPSASTTWRPPDLHDYVRVLKSTEVSRIDATRRLRSSVVATGLPRRRGSVLTRASPAACAGGSSCRPPP